MGVTEWIQRIRKESLQDPKRPYESLRDPHCIKKTSLETSHGMSSALPCHGPRGKRLTLHVGSCYQDGGHRY